MLGSKIHKVVKVVIFLKYLGNVFIIALVHEIEERLALTMMIFEAIVEHHVSRHIGLLKKSLGIKNGVTDAEIQVKVPHLRVSVGDDIFIHLLLLLLAWSNVFVVAV